MSVRVLYVFNCTFIIVPRPSGLHVFRIFNDGKICCLEPDPVVVPFQVAPPFSHCKCSGGILKQPRNIYGDMKSSSHMSMQIPNRWFAASTHTSAHALCRWLWRGCCKSVCFVATPLCAPVLMLPKNTAMPQRGPTIPCDVGSCGCLHIK